MKKHLNKTVKKEPTEKKPVRYEDRIVAYIDILGFSELITETDNDDGKLKRVFTTLEMLNTQEELDQFNVVHRLMKNTHPIKYACFSDSITISFPCSTKEMICENFSTLMISVATLGYNLALLGVFIRGGISVGKFIHTDSGIVAGPPLIEAHNLESNVAKNARIILSSKLLSRMNDHPAKNANHFCKRLQRYEDGCIGFDQLLFLDALQDFWLKKDDAIYQFLNEKTELIRSRIVAALDKYSEHPDVYAKYKWLRERFNSIVEKYPKSASPIRDEKHLQNAKCLSFREIDQKEGTARIIQ